MEVYRQACNYTEYKFSEIEFSIIMHKETIRVKPESETLRDKNGVSCVNMKLMIWKKNRIQIYIGTELDPMNGFG